MTWIQAPKNYKRIKPVAGAPEEFDDPVEFNENGTANVKEEIAEYLVKNYEMIDYSDNESDSDES